MTLKINILIFNLNNHQSVLYSNSNKYQCELNCFMMLFFSFMKVILRMFIEGPFKVDGLCKQVDSSDLITRCDGESQITVNVKQKKNINKLAGASLPPAARRAVWLKLEVPGGGGGGEPGLHHLQPASNQQSSSGSCSQDSHLVDREGRTQ